MQQWSHTHAIRVHLNFKIPEYGRNPSEKRKNIPCIHGEWVSVCAIIRRPLLFYSTARRHFIIRRRHRRRPRRCYVSVILVWFLSRLRWFRALKQNCQFKAIFSRIHSKRKHTYTLTVDFWAWWEWNVRRVWKKIYYVRFRHFTLIRSGDHLTVKWTRFNFKKCCEKTLTQGMSKRKK